MRGEDCNILVFLRPKTRILKKNLKHTHVC
jgi:hypothetical protein